MFIRFLFQEITSIICVKTLKKEQILSHDRLNINSYAFTRIEVIPFIIEYPLN